VKYALAVLVLCGLCSAQEQSFPKENRFTIPTFLALQASDAWATDKGFNSGNWQEHNPLVSSDRSTRIVYFAGTAGAVILTGYILHRTNHHLMEKALMHIAIGTEAYASAHSWAGQ
jgi:hypothetical protein